ncbi:MAG TPA: biotin/lipoyl-binding protein, partial [Anaerolineae bacterium]
MKKIAIWLLSSGLILLAACSGSSSTQSTQQTPGATQVAVKVNGKIVAEGRVVPVRNAVLSFQASGVISEVLAVEGVHVDMGQVLVRLDSRQQRAAVAQAQAGRMKAQANLDALKAGSRAQEVQTAQAALDASQAQLAKLQAGALPEDIAATSAAVSIAQAQLQQVQEGASVQQIEAAHADVANAGAALKQAQYAYDMAYKQDP